jgi:hypothetical protein
MTDGDKAAAATLAAAYCAAKGKAEIADLMNAYARKGAAKRWSKS